jgi:hypothetical protein
MITGASFSRGGGLGAEVRPRYLAEDGPPSTRQRTGGERENVLLIILPHSEVWDSLINHLLHLGLNN